MVSIVDPIGKRVIGLNPLGTQAATSPPEAHLRGPENYDTPRSRDIFNVARRLEVSRPPVSPPQPPQRASLLQQLLRLIGYGGNNNKKKKKKKEEQKQPPRPEIRVMTIENFQTQRHTCQYQRTYNPTHRLLPEEHIAAWRKKQHEREQISKNNNNISSKRQFHGPIPKRPEIDPLTTTTIKNLSPLELEIYHTIRPIGRCATFTPFTSSSTRREQIMLVHPTDLPHLQHIQNLAREISPRDKTCVVKSLEGLLIPQLVAVLKILLLVRPEVRVTSRSGEEEEGEGEGGGGGGGGGGTGKVGLRRPASWEIFAGGVRDSWEQVSVGGGGLGGAVEVERGRMENVAAAGDLGGERGKSQKKEKKRRIRCWWRSSKDQPSPPPSQQQPLSIFKSFSQKEFMPELTLDSSASSSSSSSSSSSFQNKKNPPFQPHLRGGGGDDTSTDDDNKEAKSTPLPFVRSARAYLGRSSCLNDAERVPRTLFWLAGGRVSPRMKAPTAGELRRRRQVERVNRREVGFVGTLLGVRRVCKVEGDGVGGGGGEIGVDGGDGNGEGDGG